METIMSGRYTLFLINKYFGKNFHLDPNLSFNLGLVDSFCPGNFESLNELKTEFSLAHNLHFPWMQLINPIPLNWRNIIKNNCSSTNLLLMNHQLVKKNNLIISLDNLHYQELSNMLVYISPHKPTYQLNFKICFKSKI